MKKVLAVLLALVLVLSLVACGSTATTTEEKTEAAGTVKIAVAAPMTGDNAEYTSFISSEFKAAS